uniref:Uncharacterized protein n=1 Tax=Lactuca sativa TaxID=4236 RepID=A0A9R1WMF3_LACSA|nr:hypothetical protein LSAT_V11C100016320 [Lactuca sativa]
MESPPPPLSYIDSISADISNCDHNGKSPTFGNPASHSETRSSSSPPLTSKSTMISATWLFCSAIPTLLAFKRAAESLEKLLNVTREELPDTMVVVRLSGMEISDLTMAVVRLSGMEISDFSMELSDLGLAFFFPLSYAWIHCSLDKLLSGRKKHEITQGVKSSTRAVCLAEEILRRLTNMNPAG